MVLSRDEILKHSGPVTEHVWVEAWGGEVIVRGMSGRDRDAWEASMFVQKGRKIIASPDNTRAKLVVRCLVDEQGRRIFSDGDVDEVGNMPSAGLSQVYDVATRLSGISEEDQADIAADFGEAATEPAATNGSSSSTTSPSISTPPSDGSWTTPPAES